MSDKLLFEDVVGMQDKWATGISGRQVCPTALTLLDLLKKGDLNKQHPNEVASVTPEVMPHNAQMLVELMGDLYAQALEVKSALRIARQNPVLVDRDEAKAKIDHIIKKINMIGQLVGSIGKDIDNFSIDKPKK